MGWFDSLFGRRPRPANELFAGFRRKSRAPTGSNLLERAEEKIGTGRRLLSSLTRIENSKGATIMSAIDEIQPAVADERSDKLSFIAPVALALGGALSLVWACSLGLGTYALVCWLFA
jgi:hypothetical protein